MILRTLNTLRGQMCSLVAASILLGGLGVFRSTYSQSLSLDRDRGHNVLENIKNDIKKNYFDPQFRGIDLEARFKIADEKIKQATGLGQIFGIIAQVLVEFNDSHTRFLPPQWSAKTEYGWQMQIIGDKCYVTAVKPGSDAELKGLKAGDVIHAVNKYRPTRDTLKPLRYIYYTLSPQKGLQVVAQSPGGEPRQLDLMAKVRQGKQVINLTEIGESDINDFIREIEREGQSNPHRYYDDDQDVFIWKMPEFNLSPDKVDDLINKARKHKAVILDLRRNPGGYEQTLLRLVGNFFEQDVKIGTLVGRTEKKPLIAKTRGKEPFKGQLVVLVDSESGSSAEIFARIVQLEKRGTVVGDTTAGAVMRARFFNHALGTDTVIPYGVSVTNADLIMSDGNSLEKSGVIPDTVILPTGEDLAAKRDPVLARAAEIVGAKLSAEKAGAMFPFEWPK
jgi:C-terminal processing protease CtpA/Prc